MAAVMIVAAALFGVELANIYRDIDIYISLRDISGLETGIMTAIWPQQALQGKGSGLHATAAGSPSGPLYGSPVQTDVLAGTDCAQPRHSADGNTGHLGAHNNAQGNGPAETSA